MGFVKIGFWDLINKRSHMKSFWGLIGVGEYLDLRVWYSEAQKLIGPPLLIRLEIQVVEHC